jgi:DNA-binding CsgD family transcriptional regulator
MLCRVQLLRFSAGWADTQLSNRIAGVGGATSRGTEDWQRIVGQIYEAALDPTCWAETLREIAASLNATGAVFGYHDGIADIGANTLPVDLYPDVMDTYATHYHRQDPWAQAAGDLKEGDICTGRQLVGDQRALLRSEFYDRFLRPIGAIDVMACICIKEGSNLGFAGFFRKRASGCFESDDQKWFATLAPHLRRATKIHQNMTMVRLEEGAQYETLDQLAFGVVILDESARLRFANRAARVVLDAADGISIAGDRLGCASPQEDDRLNMAIRVVLGTDREAVRGETLLVSRSNDAPAYQVLIAPFQRQPVGLDIDLFNAARRGAIVFIGDPAWVPVSAISILQGLYGLTDAESEVATALAQGRSIDRIAEERQVTRNTVRAQLARIYDKTGTSRQAETVMLVQRALIMSGRELDL